MSALTEEEMASLRKRFSPKDIIVQKVNGGIEESVRKSLELACVSLIANIVGPGGGIFKEGEDSIAAAKFTLTLRVEPGFPGWNGKGIIYLTPRDIRGRYLLMERIRRTLTRR